jgi:hypothetical protein
LCVTNREQTAFRIEAAQLRYEEDAATLEPYLPLYGLRTLESVSWSGESASAPADLVPPGVEQASPVKLGRGFGTSGPGFDAARRQTMAKVAVLERLSRN